MKESEQEKTEGNAQEHHPEDNPQWQFKIHAETYIRSDVPEYRILVRFSQQNIYFVETADNQ